VAACFIRSATLCKDHNHRIFENKMRSELIVSKISWTYRIGVCVWHTVWNKTELGNA